MSNSQKKHKSPSKSTIAGSCKDYKIVPNWAPGYLMDKWTRKYMLLAKTLAEDNDACYARKIGVVLVSENNRIISMGYNGSVEKAPHNDSREYLQFLYSDLLDEKEREFLATQGARCQEEFVDRYAGCRQCPRRILGIPSGEKLYLCSCAHAERNCLASANQSGVSTFNSTMYCYCGVPCHECTLQIIQAKVTRVVCLKGEGDYSKSSRGLFQMTAVRLEEVERGEIEAASSFLAGRDQSSVSSEASPILG